MSEHMDMVSRLLAFIATKTEAPSQTRRVAEIVKMGMNYWSEIDPAASFEWTRDDVSNYTTDDVVALLDEIRKIWGDDMLSWMEKNAIARDHSEDEHDMRWR